MKKGRGDGSKGIMVILRKKSLDARSEDWISWLVGRKTFLGPGLVRGKERERGREKTKREDEKYPGLEEPVSWAPDIPFVRSLSLSFHPLIPLLGKKWWRMNQFVFEIADLSLTCIIMIEIINHHWKNLLSGGASLSLSGNWNFSPSRLSLLSFLSKVSFEMHNFDQI